MGYDVILVYPKTGGDIRIWVPYSMLFLAAPLVKSKFSVKIIDQRLLKNKTYEVLKEAIKTNPLCVGISSMTGPQIKYGLELSKFVKTENPKIPIVWGGVHPSALPEQTLSNSNIDIVVRGEGEQSFLELVICLKEGKALVDVDGISYKENGKVIHNKDRGFIDLKKLPPLPYDLVEMDKYIYNSTLGKSIQMHTSRGCPHKCKFCFNKNFNKKYWRCMDTKQVIEDIKFFKSKYDIDSIFFMDDNFFVDKERVKKLVKSIITEGLNITWFADCRIDYLKGFSEDFLKLLYDSGLREIFIGAESGSSRILNFIDKGITPSDILEGNTILKRSKINPAYSFMMGFPTETREEIYQTVDIITKMLEENPDIKSATMNCYVPFPNTDLYYISIENGFKFPATLEEWGDFSFFSPPDVAWNKDKKDFLEILSFISAFITMKKTNSRLINFVWLCYSPIAKFRWKHKLLFPFIDTILFSLLKKFIFRI